MKSMTADYKVLNSTYKEFAAGKKYENYDAVMLV